MSALQARVAAVADVVWSYPVVGLCLLGALFFTIRLGFVQFRGLAHAVGLLAGRFDGPDEQGEITHFQALSAALSGTIGIGNIGGVAVAIGMGGPGAILWMWVIGLLGMATKFAECTLATHFRSTDPATGEVRGGPMFYIPAGLGPRWKGVGMVYAAFLALAGFGFSCMFQSNQAASALSEGLGVPGWVTGLALVAFGALTILGGIQRIGATAARLVPAMCLLYLGGALVVCLLHVDRLPAAVWMIFADGLSGRAALGGATGAVIMTGVRRAIFSNEAGLGSAGIAHAAVKTDEPVREGIVASLGPLIDTVVVSGATALVIVLAGAYGPEMDRGLAMESFEDPQVALADGWAQVPAVVERVPGDTALNPLRPVVDGARALAVTAGEGETAPAPYEVVLPWTEGVDGVRLSVLRGTGDAVVTVATGGHVLGRSHLFSQHEEDDLAVSGCALDGIWVGCGLDLTRGLDEVEGQPETVSITIEPEPGDGDLDLTFDRIALTHRLRGIALTSATFDESLPGFGTYVIPLAGFLFAFSTMVTWSYYGETAASYVLGSRFVTPYRVVFVCLAFVGATQSLGVVISVSDILVGVLVIPNMLALILLSGKVAELSRDYFARLKAGAFTPAARKDPPG